MRNSVLCDTHVRQKEAEMANMEMIIDSMRPSWVKGYEERVVILQEKGKERFLPI